MLTELVSRMRPDLFVSKCPRRSVMLKSNCSRRGVSKCPRRGEKVSTAKQMYMDEKSFHLSRSIVNPLEVEHCEVTLE